MATTGEKIKLVICLHNQRQTIQSLLHMYRDKMKKTGLTPYDKRKIRRLEKSCQEIESQLKTLLPPDRSISNF
jgi:predicted Rossmann-fold nucleotide-binding protein